MNDAMIAAAPQRRTNDHGLGGVMRIFKEFHFEAAHRLPNVPPEHKCSRLHGHNYKVRIEVSGELMAGLDWVCDFAMIEAIAGVIKEQVDHRYLNDVDGLENPTAEIIAKWILSIARLTIHNISSVTVWETDDCGAIAE